MKLSIIIPAHNEHAVLGACLQSIAQELERHPCDAEIIVVNNASTDDTGAIAGSFPGVIVVDEPRKGIVFARAAGFARSHGELIANIDADTVMPDGWTVTVFKEFADDRDLVALSGPYIYDELPRITRALVAVFYAGGYLLHLFYHRILRIGAMLQGGNFVVQRGALERIEGYDTSIEFYGEDTDIARRISAVGKVKWTFALPMHTSARRITEEGLLRVGVCYAANFFWMTFRHKPKTLAYKDIRNT